MGQSVRRTRPARLITESLSNPLDGASWAPAERNAPRPRNPRIALDDHRLAPRLTFQQVAHCESA